MGFVVFREDFFCVVGLGGLDCFRPVRRRCRRDVRVRGCGMYVFCSSSRFDTSVLIVGGSFVMFKRDNRRSSNSFCSRSDAMT